MILRNANFTLAQMSLENSLWLLFFPYSAEVSGMVHLACLFLLTVAPFLQLFWQLFILINKSRDKRRGRSHLWHWASFWLSSLMQMGSRQPCLVRSAGQPPAQPAETPPSTAARKKEQKQQRATLRKQKGRRIATASGLCKRKINAFLVLLCV